jgi:hypothetical protein
MFAEGNNKQVDAAQEAVLGSLYPMSTPFQYPADYAGLARRMYDVALLSATAAGPSQ